MQIRFSLTIQRWDTKQRSTRTCMSNQMRFDVSWLDYLFINILGSPAIFRSLILRQRASAFRIGQFSTFALKLRKNLYSLKCDILLLPPCPVSSITPELAGVADRPSSVDIFRYILWSFSVARFFPSSFAVFSSKIVPLQEFLALRHGRRSSIWIPAFAIFQQDGRTRINVNHFAYWSSLFKHQMIYPLG